MPCHPARARELMRKGRAVRRFSGGMFYIRLLDRQDGDVQPIACGVDPGSKKEGFSVKSESHTYLNVQADAVCWVKDAVETRRQMRRTRRFRKTPCRQPRLNRARGGWYSVIHQGAMAMEVAYLPMVEPTLSHCLFCGRGH